MATTDDFLEHYGVKGMKWGVRRRSRGEASDDSKRTDTVRDKAKKGGVKTLSNAELQAAINRMNLEQQFKRLRTNERPVVTRFIASTLQEIGKREVQAQIAKKAAKLATRVA